MTTSPLSALVETWLDGFATSRSVPVHVDGALSVIDVAAESRRLELVAVEPDDVTIAAMAERLLGTTDVWATVITARRRDFDLPAGTEVRLNDESVMVARLDPPPPPGSSVAITADGPRAFAEVRAGETVAAQGQVAVVGDTAVFDRISTHEDFRRRGLGRDVMGALTTWAVARGAEHGLLAASLDGQGLYASLGWEQVAAMATLVGTG